MRVCDERFAPNFMFNAISGRTSGLEFEQSPFCDQQVGQAEQREQLRRVLGRAPVAHFLKPEAVLDDVKRMLDLGPHRRGVRPQRRVWKGFLSHDSFARDSGED